MFDYLEDVIVEADEDLKNSRSYYPGNDSLMKVDYDSPSLPTKDAKLFHRHVARLLFASKRARPDIQVCVAFLCTRVKAPTEQDCKKLGKVISYLKSCLVGAFTLVRKNATQTCMSGLALLLANNSLAT